MATSYCIVVVANSASSLGYECCLKHTQLGLLLFRFKCQQRTRHMAHATISKSKKSKIYVLCFSVMKCFRYCRSFISCCCGGCYSFFFFSNKKNRRRRQQTQRDMHIGGVHPPAHVAERRYLPSLIHLHHHQRQVDRK